MNTTQAPPKTDQPQYEITDEDRKRIKRIQAAWKAYEGDLEKPLIPMENEADDNVLTNEMAGIVDRMGDFLFGKELEIKPDEGSPADAQDFLNTVWGKKETRIPLLLRLHMNGAMSGRAFLRIVPGRQDGTFRLIEIDPTIIYVQTAPQDCQTVLLYCIQYCVEGKGGSDGKQTIKTYYREEISRIDPEYNADNQEDALASGIDQKISWSIQHWTQQKNTSTESSKTGWTPAGDPIPWNYPFEPIQSCQNLPKPNDFWGYPDVTPDLIGVNEAVNLQGSSANRLGKLLGNPLIFSNGMGESDIDRRPGQIIHLPSDTSKLTAVAVQDAIASILSIVEDMRSSVDARSGVPSVAIGRVKDLPKGNISGVLVEMLYYPLIKKMDKKRCTYGDIVISTSKALVQLNGMSSDIDISLLWQNPLPSDDLGTVQSAIAKKEIGISDTTLQRELGYDPEEEQELSQLEDAKKLVNFSRGMGMPPSTPLQGDGQAPPASQPPQQQPGGLPQAVPGVAPLPGQPPAIKPGG
jgi:hypothetical protein